MNMADRLGAITKEVTNVDGTERPRARVMPAPTQLMHSTVEFRRMESELEELQRNQGAGVLLSLACLRPSPYQIGGLDEARVAALTENLRANPLNSPIVVRSVGSGVYEIMAGHHRVEVYQRLGRSEIRAVVTTAGDDEAERLVFFDNLFAPELSDYFKYQGFSRRRKNKGLTHEQLADEAGVSREQVTRLFAFEKLPAAVLDLIAAAPKSVSYSAAAALVPHCATQPDRVVEAVNRLISGKLTTAKVAAWLADRPAAPTPRRSVSILAGRKKYAEVSRYEGRLVVRFADPTEAARLQTLVEGLLREQAAVKPAP